MDPKLKSDLKSRLTPEEYRVIVDKGTEAPFSGEYDHHFQPGQYDCKVCGKSLFDSDSKFDSGCGWPSFDRGLDQEAIAEHRDLTHGMIRTEITCKHCGAHLGHVFPDGPTATGLRYCVNSASLKFKMKDEK